MRRRITATLGIRRRSEGETDVYGNPQVSYEPAVPWPVYAVQPRQASEPGEPNRDPVATGLTVLAPLNGPRPTALDLIEYRGELWGVTGEVAEWAHNPQVPVTTQAGIVVNIDRTEG